MQEVMEMMQDRPLLKCDIEMPLQLKFNKMKAECFVPD